MAFFPSMAVRKRAGVRGGRLEHREWGNHNIFDLERDHVNALLDKIEQKKIKGETRRCVDRQRHPGAATSSVKVVHGIEQVGAPDRTAPQLCTLVACIETEPVLGGRTGERDNRRAAILIRDWTGLPRSRGSALS
jgi:hypothetical protein